MTESGTTTVGTVEGQLVTGSVRTHTQPDFLPELRLGLDNLRAHKLRSLLTMLGMIFGVAAVVAMLSIVS